MEKKEMRAAIYTLGCKVNQNESAAVAELLRQHGWQVVPPEEKADIYIVNSCTVTAEGGAKSRRWLRRAKRENPAAITVLSGCFPQAFPMEALEAGADVITGAAARSRLPGLIEEYLNTGRRVVDIAPQSKVFETLPAAKPAGHTRAFLKVQDGCNRRCAYCIIPTARGPSRSRPQADILEEAEKHAAQGVREVVLTGINLPSYGRDTNTGLADLVEALAGVEGLSRIRLSSLDPDFLTDEDIERLARVEAFCPQFHLSLQSGCANTLRRMRRPYTPEQYRRVVAQIRTALPAATLTTDVIVGFPGESDADFEESLRFVQELSFLKVHVFPFSKRAGTPAAEMEEQVPRSEKERRAKKMQTAADAVRRQLLEKAEGMVAEVLLETPLADGRYTGYTQHYLPVVCQGEGLLQGQVVPVRLEALEGERLRAIVLKKG